MSDTLKILQEQFGKGIPVLFIFDYEMKQPIVLPAGEALQRRIHYNIHGRTNTRLTAAGKPPTLDIQPVDFNTYLRSFEQAQKHQQRGDSYLLNLTFPTRVGQNLDLAHIYQSSIAPYKLMIEDKFVVFSPETFITINNGVLAAHPMKGTIDASVPEAEQVLLSDKKEAAEHATIVDLIRNDMSIHAKDVNVKRYRYISKIRSQGKTLLQTSTEITASIKNTTPAHIAEILYSMLPAGSVTGSPKQKTIEIIRQTEQYNRGYYTGVFGIFDGQTLDSAVMIRYIEKQGNEYVYKSGGGITVYSDARKEYDEMIDKIYVPVG